MGTINGTTSSLPMSGGTSQIGDGNTNSAPMVGAPLVLTTAAATLACTQGTHAGRTVVLNSTHTQTITLPASTGTGLKYKFAVSVVGTDGSKVIKVANATDVMTGVCVSNSTATNQVSSFLTSATSDTVTFDNTTTGGIVGSTVELEDIAAGTYLVRVEAAASGTVATCFSAGVS